MTDSTWTAEDAATAAPTTLALRSRAPIGRRALLRGSLAAAAVAASGGALAGCATGGGPGGGGQQETGETSEDNPFGMPTDGVVDAVIFNGGYGYDYVQFAGDKVTELHGEVEMKISPSTNISQELQPRFTGGNPPDLIDNSGAQAIGTNAILGQLEDLTSVVDANNYEGTKIRDTLYPGALDAGTYGDKLAQLNYVQTVYAMWYSASLFEENGWDTPQTWDDLLALGSEAKKQDKYLFVWGKEAATYYTTLAICSAIKTGGDEVRLALENLEPDCWSKPAMQDVLGKMEEIVAKGYMKPGGAGTQFTAAQAQWSNQQQALIYPSGSWIENEMKDQTKDGFEMTGIPEPMIATEGGAYPFTALHSTAGEPFIVPSESKNPAGGKELLRAMLSADAATNFAKTKLAPTVVKGGIPDDGFGSTALVSQVKMLEEAGSDVFTWNFITLYGMNTDLLVVWNSFLSGNTDAAGLTKKMQDLTDEVANDDSIEKIEVK